MKKTILCGLAAFVLQGCVVSLPSMTTSVLETDSENGNQIALDGSYCGYNCLQIAMNKARETCASDYVVQSKSQVSMGSIYMVVRCRPKAKTAS
ncbi:Uncharacterised protein [Kingella potus]|uniref:Lipoprotein n=1 Tax=Kingella potus TaxID=265175 RepID=A0A377R220_9NEIS|nr:hypothetical protein [Kingella potus]UOP00390.1 hypothetical protein LVJ84_10960 [Kingella potus]STR02541.1 Uncharacterised protein [Kingella potus]